MSSISKLILGDKARDSQVIDTTAQPFQQLRGQFADQLQTMMQSPQQYMGRFAALMHPNEQQALQGVQQATGQVGQSGVGQQYLQQAGQSMNPFAGAAQLSGGEMQGLNAIQQSAFNPNPMQPGINAGLQQLIGGQMNPYGQQLMDAAVRPILDNFSDQALQQRGLYTGAGQHIQGMGSSPFAQASARLSGNVANAIGDTTAQLGANLYGQQQQGQLQGLNMAMQQPGMQLQNQIAATQALGLPREVQQMGMNNRASAFESGQGRQLQAGGALQSGGLAQQTAALQAQMQNLQAQGLPRMIEQLGIDGGLNQFNQQQQQMMQLMQLLGGVTNAGSATTSGTQASTGLAGAFLSGFSDRRLKKDIQVAGKTANGTTIYRFRYLSQKPDEPQQLGVMADEVEHIPGAVVRNAIGLAMVDYGKVMAHG